MSQKPYDETNRFWTEQALNQFGTAANFFSLLSLGFLGYLIQDSRINTLFDINFEADISMNKIFLAASLFFILISVLSGCIVVLCRTHDLRLTRHTIWTRKRYWEEVEGRLAKNPKDTSMKELPEDWIDLRPFNFCKLVTNLKSTIFRDDYFIRDDEIVAVANIENLKIKFDALRLRNLLLGKLSWKIMSLQIITLFMAAAFYLSSKL